MKCMVCDAKIKTPWGTYIGMLRSHGKRALWGVYCAKQCAVTDAHGPVFRGCVHRRITMTRAKEFFK